ncbi:hypothetical protein FPV67DRAFT_1130372 [Lyophyllum atratum]|nr:hypothetical protein FPV67DRAFT_1130372 [Lyophyllum atratum]
MRVARRVIAFRSLNASRFDPYIRIRRSAYWRYRSYIISLASLHRSHRIPPQTNRRPSPHPPVHPPLVPVFPQVSSRLVSPPPPPRYLVWYTPPPTPEPLASPFLLRSFFFLVGGGGARDKTRDETARRTSKKSMQIKDRTRPAMTPREPRAMRGTRKRGRRVWRVWEARAVRVGGIVGLDLVVVVYVEGI